MRRNKFTVGPFFRSIPVDNVQKWLRGPWARAAVATSDNRFLASSAQKSRNTRLFRDNVTFDQPLLEGIPGQPAWPDARPVCRRGRSGSQNNEKNICRFRFCNGRKTPLQRRCKGVARPFFGGISLVIPACLHVQAGGHAPSPLTTPPLRGSRQIKGAAHGFSGGGRQPFPLTRRSIGIAAFFMMPPPKRLITRRST